MLVCYQTPEHARRHGLSLILCFLLAGLCNPTSAHLLNMTRVTVEVTPGETIIVDLSLDLRRELGGGESYYDLTQKPFDDPQAIELLDRLTAALELHVDGQAFDWHVTNVVYPNEPKDAFIDELAWPMTQIRLKGQWPVAAKTDGSLQAVFTDQFRFEEPIAVTFIDQDSTRKMSRWLVRNQHSPVFRPSAESDPDGPQYARWDWREFVDYIWQGILHIVPRGWDHVLFILGLFLGFSRLRYLLAWVTGFTLAHSVTLALSTFGAISVPASIVEPLIAASIIWVAVENLLFPPAHYWRLVTVLVFGLLHGLGFASVLRAYGLPSDSILPALVGFNLGVEIAQLGVLASALLLSFFLGRYILSRTDWHSWLVRPGSLLIAAIAGYWLVERLDLSLAI